MPKTPYTGEQLEMVKGSYKDSDNRIPENVQKEYTGTTKGDQIATKRPQ